MLYGLSSPALNDMVDEPGSWASWNSSSSSSSLSRELPPTTKRTLTLHRIDWLIDWPGLDRIFDNVDVHDTDCRRAWCVVFEDDDGALKPWMKLNDDTVWHVTDSRRRFRNEGHLREYYYCVLLSCVCTVNVWLRFVQRGSGNYVWYEKFGGCESRERCFIVVV